MDKTLKAIEQAAVLVAVGFMVAIMMVVTGDVVMRYLFHSPFSWAYDLIALYMMAGVFYFVLSDAHREKMHVGIDILQCRMGTRFRHLADLLTALISLTLFSLIAYVGAESARESFANDEVMAGSIPWPMWLSAIIVPIGSALLALRLVLQSIRHLLGLTTGRALPPESGVGVRHGEEVSS
jgi:TRAP-type C4-dicarboxylate transport system permease small subunit